MKLELRDSKAQRIATVLSDILDVKLVIVRYINKKAPATGMATGMYVHDERMIQLQECAPIHTVLHEFSHCISYDMLESELIYDKYPLSRASSVSDANQERIASTAAFVALKKLGLATERDYKQYQLYPDFYYMGLITEVEHNLTKMVTELLLKQLKKGSVLV